MVREKIIKKYNDRIETGYYNESNQFILHSFNDDPSTIWYDGEIWYQKDYKFHRDNDLPAYILKDGSKFWYVDDKEYWFINNQKYFDKNEVFEKFKDKIIIVNNNISQNLTNMNIDFIKLVWNKYLILDDSERNEVILKYG